MRRRLIGWIAIAVLLAGVAGCGERPYKPVDLPRAKNVILVSIDTLRADHLGCYGYSRPTSPRIDAFAKESVRFARAYSSSNWTLPGHAGMLTGRMTTRHGGLRFDSALREDVPLVSQVVQGAGFDTAAFVSHTFVTKKYGFGRGFDTFDYKQSIGSVALTDKALAWLEKRTDEKGFFLFLHYFDVHNPYGKADAPVEQFTSDAQCRGPVEVGKVIAAALQRQWGAFDCFTALYDADIALVDRELGRLFDFLKARGRFEDTLIVVTSDHGELLGKGEGATHGVTLREAEIAVPLLLRFPGGAGGRGYVASPVSTIQIAPTILDSVGLPVFDTDLPSLLPLLAGGPAPAWVGADSSNTGYQQIAMVKDRYKLFQPPEFHMLGARLAPLLVDLDRSEDEDIWAEQPQRARDMIQLARRSDLYGEGTCFEFAHQFDTRYGNLKLRLTLPAGVEPVFLRPIHRQFATAGGKLRERFPQTKRDGNTIEVRLDPSRQKAGIVVVLPQGAALTAELLPPGKQGLPPLFAGEDRHTWDGDSLTLPATDAAWMPASGSDPPDDYLWVRNYGVLHMEHPAGGPSDKRVELDKRQRDALRALGYLGM